MYTYLEAYMDQAFLFLRVRPGMGRTCPKVAAVIMSADDPTPAGSEVWLKICEVLGHSYPEARQAMELKIKEEYPWMERYFPTNSLKGGIVDQKKEKMIKKWDTLEEKVSRLLWPEIEAFSKLSGIKRKKELAEEGLKNIGFTVWTCHHPNGCTAREIGEPHYSKLPPGWKRKFIDLHPNVDKEEGERDRKILGIPVCPGHND